MGTLGFNSLSLFFALAQFGICSSRNVLANEGLNRLKQISVNGSSVELTFEGNASKNSISIDYVNEIIQLSLRNTSIYPAKIIPVQGKVIKKVFAYQYSPSVVRCRFSVSGKAEDYKERIIVEAQGRVVKLRVQDLELSEEKMILERVSEMTTRSESSASAGQPISENSQPAKADESVIELKQEAKLTGGKPLPSMWSVFGKMGLLLLALGVVLAVVKKVKTGNIGTSKGVGSFTDFVKNVAQGKIAKDDKMIEVVTSHYLDPKKKIVVVKVAGKVLVLGVTSDSISLITQMSSGNEGVDSTAFEDLIDSKSLDLSKPAVSNVRSRIRSRLEGLKPL